MRNVRRLQILDINAFEVKQSSVVKVEHSEHEGCRNRLLSDGRSYTTETTLIDRTKSLQIVKTFMIQFFGYSKDAAACKLLSKHHLVYGECT